MAFSGLHASCHFVGGEGFGKEMVPIPSQPVWSETMASAATSANVVAGSDPVFKGRPMIRVRASADSYVSFAVSPNASTGARVFIAANTDYDFFVKVGDRLAWILVP